MWPPVCSSRLRTGVYWLAADWYRAVPWHSTHFLLLSYCLWCIQKQDGNSYDGAWKHQSETRRSCGSVFVENGFMMQPAQRGCSVTECHLVQKTEPDQAEPVLKLTPFCCVWANTQTQHSAQEGSEFIHLLPQWKCAEVGGLRTSTSHLLMVFRPWDSHQPTSHRLKTSGTFCCTVLKWDHWVFKVWHHHFLLSSPLYPHYSTLSICIRECRDWFCISHSCAPWHYLYTLFNLWLVGKLCPVQQQIVGLEMIWQVWFVYNLAYWSRIPRV